MELRNLNTFVRAADTGSFSRAASQLGYTQSTVTAQIQGLEEELGVKLFDRLPKGIALTAAGDVLLEHARGLLLGVENARLAVDSRREPSGKLRIGAFSSLCTAFLPELLGRYHQLYPKVDLVVRSGGIGALQDMLGSGQLDFAWVIADQEEKSAWRASCGMSHPIWAVAAPGRFCFGKTPSAVELADITFLMTEPGCPYRRQFELFCREQGIVPHVLMEADSIEGIRSFAQSGLGIGILPDFAVRPMVEDGRLERVMIGGFTPAVESALLCHPLKWMTPAMEAFLQLAGAREGEKLRQPGQLSQRSQNMGKMHKNMGRDTGQF